MNLASGVCEASCNKEMMLREIVSSDQVVDSEIRQWEANDSRAVYTHHYIAYDDGAEVGFLSVDISPDEEHIVIYKLFVPPRLRRQGIGTEILKAAETLGRGLGYRKSLLNPHTLADDFLQKDLESWYLRSGYKPLADSHGAFTKDISE